MTFSANATNEKSPDAYRTISEVAEAMTLPQHVLRFWETRFPQIKPLKRAGGRRYYRPDDVELLKAIKRLLYDQGYTIKGVQKLIRELGPPAVARGEFARAEPEAPDDATHARMEPNFDVPAEAQPNHRAPGLGAEQRATLRAALAEIREAERQLRQARGQ